MQELTDGQVLDADICIIGAGAAGISLALQFVSDGLSVLLVESGGQRRTSQIQDMYAGQVVRPQFHAEPDRFRCRQFGGSTTLWGGRCMPYDPIDFEPRRYIPNSGWPFHLQELQPFYEEANRICEAGAYQYQYDEAFGKAAQPIIDGFASRNFSTDQLERFSMPTNFADRYGDVLKQSRAVRVLLHATATRLVFNNNGSLLEQVQIRNLSGKTASVRAKTFVLATGGIEVARLLLANRDVHRNGVGNQHGVVGKYYMCHLAGTLGRIQIKGDGAVVRHDYEIAEDGTYCRRRFSLLPERQRELEIGNFVARLHHPRIADPSHNTASLSLVFLGSRLLPWEYRTRLTSDGGTSMRQYLHHVTNVARDPFSAVTFATRMVTGRFLAKRKIPSLVIKPKANLFSLDFLAEQVPNADSRITLCDEADAMGMPRVKIDWHYTSQDVKTVKIAVALLAQDMESSGVGKFDYDPDEVELEVVRYGAYGGHHIGTARMGDNPRSSVVDGNCRVHGLENLYISSAATFPTSSQANPTLTIVALALRLAAHLRGRLRSAGGIAQRATAS